MTLLSPSYPPDETAVRVAAGLYEARDTVRRFHGAQYREKLQPYMDLIKKVAAARDLPILRAGKLLAVDKENSGMTQLHLLAATVELIEPTP